MNDEDYYVNFGDPHPVRVSKTYTEADLREAKAQAWAEGFKQGGPMHDVNYDDPDAHTRNPYRASKLRSTP